MPSKKASRGRSDATSAADCPFKQDAPEKVELNHGIAGEPVVKRRKGLGVRVIGGRIYDSVNGKTCHQCRQKVTDPMAPCKSTWGVKMCTQNFCTKCLLNRYGERTEEVSQLDNWKCPRCRGDCNCSICLKKQGRTPTGILTHAAKATGFSSVAELLKKCPNLKADNRALLALKVLKKEAVKSELGIGELQIKGVEGQGAHQILSKSEVSHRAKNKVNNITMTDGEKTQKDSRHGSTELASLNRKKGSRAIRLAIEIDLNASPKKEVNEKLLLEASKENELVNNPRSGGKKTSNQEGNVNEKKNTKLKNFYSDSSKMSIDTSEPDLDPNKHKVPSRKQLQDIQECNNEDLKCEKSKNNAEFDVKGPKKRRRITGLQFAFSEEKIALPNGASLLTVGGVDFPAEAIGAALQLMEFCSAFKSVLELKKGDVEAMLRELTKGRLVRKGANSLLVQFQAKLLSLIVHGSLGITDVVSLSSTDKNSWLNFLKRHLAEKSTAFMCLPRNSKATSDDLVDETDIQVSLDDESLPATTDEDMRSKKPQSNFFTMSETLKNNLLVIRDAIEGGPDGYEKLGMQHKLQLLVILCDDCLETEYMRNFIETAHREYCEAQRENREVVIAARKEERNIKQKIKDTEVAKYFASANIVGPLAPKQQEELLAIVEAETEKAVAAASFTKEAVSLLNKGRNNAVRTDKIAWAPDGRVYYKLNGVNNLKSVVLQDIGGFDNGEQDHWAIYSEEEETILLKHLEQRVRQSRRKVCAEVAQRVSPTRRQEEKENQVPFYTKVS